MLKERIQEIFEFSKSESPYRKANKGWIRPDIFLDLNASSDTFNQRSEAAKVTLFWSPITILLTYIFLIIIMGSLLVFASSSFVKGRVDFTLFNNFITNDKVKVEENKVLTSFQLNSSDSKTSEIENNIDINEVIKTNKDKLSDEIKFKLNEKVINNKVEKVETKKRDIGSKKDLKNVKNIKSKSNFI